MTYLQELRQMFVHLTMYGATYVLVYNLSQWWNEKPLWIPCYSPIDIATFLITLIILSPLIFVIKSRLVYERGLREKNDH